MASRYGGQTQQKQVLRLSNKQSGTRSSEVIREWGWQTNGVVCCCLKTHTSLGLPHDLASLSHHLKAHTITLSCVSRNYSNCTKLPEANTRVVAHWFGMTLHRQPVWMASLATPSHRNAHHTTVNRNTSSIRHLTPTWSSPLRLCLWYGHICHEVPTETAASKTDTVSYQAWYGDTYRTKPANPEHSPLRFQDMDPTGMRHSKTTGIPCV